MPAARRLLTLGLIFAGAHAGASVARAHDYWLELSSYRPEPGGRVAVTHRVGERLKGDAVPRNPLAIVRFAALAPGGVEAPVSGRDGFDPAGVVLVDQPGTWRVVYQSRPSYVELDAGKFDAYLELEGIAGVQEERERLGEGKGSAREAFSRSAIALACVRGEVASSAAAQGSVGLTVEIVPDGDLCAAKAGDELAFRLLELGKPRAGVTMLAVNRETSGEPMKVLTDERGRFHFRLPRAGFWLIKGVAMQRAIRDPKADWQSRWASLTFELGETGR